MNIVSCNNLSVKYDSGFAVKDVSFSLARGDYLCVVGENGSGKTTLMKTILGLIRPATGSVAFGGLKRTEIGYLPQQTVVQKDFPANVFEVVLSGRLNRHGAFPFYTKRDKAAAREAISRLGADEFRHKCYRDLSGGQQQRVLLARALCATDKLLMLDEPVTGLDPIMAAELYGLLDTLNRQGITLIMISHDINSAVARGSKILHLNTTPLFFGGVKDYIASDVGVRMMGGGGA